MGERDSHIKLWGRGAYQKILNFELECLRWSLYPKVNSFAKELCRKLLPSLYRDSRPDFKLSLFRSHVIIVND